jgi:hypothetical protein
VVTNWKTLFNFCRYKVSDTGLVYDEKLSRLVSQNTNSDGYLCITLKSNEGPRKGFKVHRLVCTLYLDNPERKETVNHKDGIKSNNNASNLEWNTRSENIQHAWDTGLIKDLEGRKEGIREKQGKKVLCITTGVVYNSIGKAADELGLKKSNISSVCLNKVGCKTAGKSKKGEPLEWEFYYE